MTHFREFTRRETKARKAHVCAECHTPIEVGTIYIRNGQQMGREFSSIARHVNCLIVADRFAGLLMTGVSFRLFLLPGIKNNPDIWPKIKTSIAKEFPDVVLRLSLAGAE